MRDIRSIENAERERARRAAAHRLRADEISEYNAYKWAEDGPRHRAARRHKYATDPAHRSRVLESNRLSRCRNEGLKHGA